MNIENLTFKVTVRRVWLLKIAAYIRFFAGTLFDWAIKKTVKVG
jgi:hypothetical protein